MGIQPEDKKMDNEAKHSDSTAVKTFLFV